MAEVIGVIAAIPALIDAAQQCIEILKTLKNGKHDCAMMLCEMTNLQLLLDTLYQRAKGGQTLAVVEKCDNPATTPLALLQGRLTRLKEFLTKVDRSILPGGRLLFEKSKWRSIVEDLERDKLMLSLAIQADTRDDLSVLTQVVNGNFKNILDALDGLQDTIQETSDKVTDIQDMVAARETLQLLRWIAPFDQPRGTDLARLRRKREGQPAPGAWFLNSEAFKLWETGPDQVLHCSGKRGVGKTMLGAIVVDHLRIKYPESPVASIFCKPFDNEDSPSEVVLRSVLRQILGYQISRGQSLQLLKSLRDTNRSSENGDEPADFEIIQKFLKSIINDIDLTFVVVDALDELSDVSWVREDVLDAVLQLNDFGRVKVMVTHRDGIQPPVRVSNSQQITVEADPQEICQYLRINIEKRGLKSLQPRLDYVVNKISQVARGIFLVACLLLDKLPRDTSISMVEVVLEKASNDVNDYYQEDLDSIKDETVLQALRWVARARRNLTCEELGHALWPGPISSSINKNDMRLYVEDIVSRSAGFLSIDEQSKVVAFDHDMAKTFITNKICQNTDLEIARRCLEYLSIDELLEPIESEDTKGAVAALENRYSLLRYATRFWGNHAKASGEILRELRMQILKFTNQPYRVSDMYLGSWCENMFFTNSMRIWKGRDHLKEQDQPAKLATPTPDLVCSGAHLAVYYRAPDILKLLIDSNASLSQPSPTGPPLVWAAKLDRLTAVRRILQADRKIDINAAGADHVTPLLAAITASSLRVVEVLIEHGANVHRPDRYGETPLHKACFYDRDDVVQFLWEHGAHRNINTGAGGQLTFTPLAFCLDAGRPKCRELLLFKYKAFNLNRARLPIPLEDPEILGRLLHEGTDPNIALGLGQSSLDVAMILRDANLIQKCLSLGAKPRLYWRDDDPILTTLRQQNANEPWMPTLDRLVSQQTHPRHSKSRTEEIQSSEDKKTYIELPIPRDTRRITRIMFTITSHDQGYTSFLQTRGTYRGSQTFFVARVLRRRQGPRGEPTYENVTELLFVVWNVQADGEWKTHRVMWDSRDENRRLGSWMAALVPGNVLHLNMRCQGGGVGSGGASWCNFVKEARVDLFE